ncbi:ABC transporter ATP-binding protein [Paenibacillus sp. GCM10012307]|uniref:ABC transporter ATP-binding protein n=1 Tax=Paenibacillus roseus TaxID=2798579 RepID=A0A934J6P1_9BACL|nr:ABC transporter ATP-binding protein [Paenibacillus roseus]MBJ6361370.1 ABC transporter ATP-binding protein [Paenibacillus roseus]
MTVISEAHQLSVADRSGRLLVAGSSFSLRAGKTLALIGESGSGKTLTVKAMLGILPYGLAMGGELLFRGRNTAMLSKQEWRQVRGRQISIIFQHPEQALHPAIPVGRQLGDLLRSHLPLTRLEAERRAQAMLGKVELKAPALVMKQYPSELSGGMNQRVMIAMALILEPQLLIADEATSALDMITQAQIVDLLRELTREAGMSMLLVTHDLLVAGYLADEAAVMQQGLIIEQGPASQILGSPQHAYTQQLVEAAKRSHLAVRSM